MKFNLLFLIISIPIFMNAQNKETLLFEEMPPAPKTYEAGNMITRMIDGLGYRFHWASKGLTESDLKYKPSESGKSALETIEHIYDLSITINNVATKMPNIRPTKKSELSFAILRFRTLDNLMNARNQFLNKKDSVMKSYTVIFQNGGNKSEYPIWNFINGPLEDAIYHTGQLVVFRRATKNPIDSNVRVFTGKNAN